RMGEAVMVRTARMQNPRDRQVEIQLIVRQPRERSRRDGHTVIGLAAADDLLFPRPAERVVHIPDELYLTFLPLRTGGEEEYFRRGSRRDLLEPCGGPDRGVMALGGEEMAEG